MMGEFEILLLSNGLYIFRFSNGEDMLRVPGVLVGLKGNDY